MTRAFPFLPDRGAGTAVQTGLSRSRPRMRGPTLYFTSCSDVTQGECEAFIGRDFGIRAHANGHETASQG